MTKMWEIKEENEFLKRENKRLKEELKASEGERKYWKRESVINYQNSYNIVKWEREDRHKVEGKYERALLALFFAFVAYVACICQIYYLYI